MEVYARKSLRKSLIGLLIWTLICLPTSGQALRVIAPSEAQVRSDLEVVLGASDSPHPVGLEEDHKVQVFDDYSIDPAGWRLGKSIRSFQNSHGITRGLFDELSQNSAQRVVISGVSVRGGQVNFLNEMYRVAPLQSTYGGQAVLHVDVENRTLLQAFDQETHALIYPLADAVVAGALPPKSVQVYLDAEIKSGKLQPGGKLVSVLRHGNALSGYLAGLDASLGTVSLAGMPISSANKGKAAFSISGDKIVIPGKKIEQLRGKQLLVVLDSEMNPAVAYLMDSGEEVYSASEAIRVYYNPKLKAGKLVGDVQSDDIISVVGHLATVWARAPKETTEIALAGVKASKRKLGQAAVSDGHRGRPVLNRPYADVKGKSLLLVFDDAQALTAVYEEKSGDQLFAKDDQLSLYLGALDSGHLPESDPFLRARMFKKTHWSKVEDEGQSRVSVGVIETFELKSKTAATVHAFSFGGKMYRTTRPFNEGDLPIPLVVVSTVKHRIPVAAYVVGTDEDIFGLSGRQSAYLDPVIVGGRIQDGELYAVQSSIGKRSLDRVPDGTTILAISGRLGEPDDLGNYFVKWENTRHMTSIVLAEEAQRPPMLVLIDVKKRVPIRVYNELTGELVFDYEDRFAAASEMATIRVYVDPETSGGRLAELSSHVAEFERHRLRRKTLQSYVGEHTSMALSGLVGNFASEQQGQRRFRIKLLSRDYTFIADAPEDEVPVIAVLDASFNNLMLFHAETRKHLSLLSTPGSGLQDIVELARSPASWLSQPGLEALPEAQVTTAAEATLPLRTQVNLLPSIEVKNALGVVAGGLEENPAGLAYGVALHQRAKSQTGHVLPVVFLATEAEAAILQRWGIGDASIFVIGSSDYPTLTDAERAASEYLRIGLGVQGVVHLGVYEEVSLLVQQVLDHLLGVELGMQIAAQWQSVIRKAFYVLQQA